MKLYDLINTTALNTRLKIYQPTNKEIALLVDCDGYEVREKLALATLFKDVAFMSIIKDDKGVALNVLITE